MITRGRCASRAEISARLESSDDEILEALEARTAKQAGSLDTPERADREALRAHLGDTEDGYGQAEARADARALVDNLEPRERRILALRFAEDLTQAEIGERVGLSQMQVSRLIRRSLEELREHAAEQPE